MSHEFVAPIVTEMESSKNTVHTASDSTLSKYHEIAIKRYHEALAIAEKIDDRVETSIPFNRNAVYAASLLMHACVRGAQIS